MRESASQSLHCLTVKAPEYMASTILPLLLKGCTSIDLVERHGAMLAAAEVTHALSKRTTPDRCVLPVYFVLCENILKVSPEKHFPALPINTCSCLCLLLIWLL